jgi:hypothetical protein
MSTDRRTAIAATLLASLAGAARSQHGGGTAAAPAPTSPPREAAQFDFLIGQWELEVTPKVAGLAAMLHGAPRLSGGWKAWKAFDGFGIEDELRIVDASANPIGLSHALRVYDSRARRWSVTTLDAYRAHIASSQGQWQDGEMRLSGSGTSPAGKPTLTRTRYHDITANGFKLRQDRSGDDGASWDDAVLTIVARRTAAKAPR